MPLSVCILSDLTSIVATIVALYEACTVSETDYRLTLGGFGLWIFPALPTALIGLCLLIGERFFPRSSRANQWLLALILFVLTAAAVIFCVILAKLGTNASGQWYIGLIFYLFMLIPLYCMPQLLPLWCVLLVFPRVGSVAFAALRHYSGGQPYCKMPGPAFAAVYLAMGGIAAVLAGIGVMYHAVRTEGSALLGDGDQNRCDKLGHLQAINVRIDYTKFSVFTYTRLGIILRPSTTNS